MSQRPLTSVSMRLLAVICACLVVVVTPKRADASIFGEENATLIAILTEDIEAVVQAYRTVEGIVQEIEKLERLIGQGQTLINQGRTVLRQVQNPQEFANLLMFAQRATRTLQNLNRDIKYLGYKLESIDGEHREVFPTTDSLSAMPGSDFGKRAQKWHNALRESSAIAMRAQTSVSTLEQRGQTIEKITSSSSNSEGVVAQLQCVVNALALLHSDLNAIEQNLAAGQRVTATWAGVEVSERDLAKERAQRMMKGYTDPGRRAHLLEELP